MQTIGSGRDASRIVLEGSKQTLLLTACLMTTTSPGLDDSDPADQSSTTNTQAEDAKPPEASPEAEHQAQMEEALVLAKEGKQAEAESIYRALIAAGSQHGKVYVNLGVLCGLNERYEERLTLFLKALELDPGHHQARLNLGIAYLEKKEFEQARQCFEACLLQQSDWVLATTGLASVAEHQGDREQARDLYERAIEVDATCGEALSGLGLLEQADGNHPRAESLFQRCLEKNPTDSKALAHLANSLQLQMRGDEAMALLRKGLEQRPGEVPLMLELAKLLYKGGKADEAFEVCLCAVANSPENGQAMAACGMCLQAMGLIDEANGCYKTASELDPTDFALLNQWACMLSDSGELDGALEIIEKACAINPEQQIVRINHAGILRNLGCVDEAIKLSEEIIKSYPDDREVHASVMFTYSIASERYAARALEVGSRLWELTRKEIKPSALAFSKAHWSDNSASNTVNPSPGLECASTGRRIHIGILCPDLGDHVVSRYLLPFLRNYDRSKLSIELILSIRRYEQRADQLIALADSQVSICGLDDQAARSVLQGQHYDVILETSGFTKNSSLDLLAVRCAPVQCHYIGYHATTALDTIDYFIGDDLTVPEEFSWQFSEKLWRLPRAWLAMEHLEPLPPLVEMHPSLPLILGSFNQLTKVRHETLRFWGTALQQLPSSLLLLKDRAYGNASTVHRITASLSDLGVAPERIKFLPPVESWSDHMQLYNNIDIALDATPGAAPRRPWRP